MEKYLAPFLLYGQKRSQAINEGSQAHYKGMGFLGVASIAPDDEYDCLVGPLTSLVAKGASRDELKTYIEEDLRGHFGLGDNDYLRDNLDKALELV